jgi:hypothetical protein
VIVEDGELDAAMFDAEIREARALVARGEWRRARHLLDEALRRWYGPALIDAGGAGWARPEIARLEESQQVAIEMMIDVCLALGETADAITRAEAAVAASPLRERRWAQLMTAQYRAGRQTDALRAYQRLRSQLVEELGVEPCDELRTLERAILAQDPILASRGVPPATSATHATAAAPFRPRRSDEASPSPRLVRLVESALFRFVGRDAELDRLAALLETAQTGGGPRIVLIGGEPGGGKTRLAAEFAMAAHTAGARVCFGSCEEGVRAPYGSWIGVLTDLLRSPEVDIAGALDAVDRAALARISPRLAQQLAQDRPSWGQEKGSTAFLLMEAVIDVLVAASSTQPLVVILDDLHWADIGTLRLLAHIVRTPAAVRALIIGTFRSTELSPPHPLAELLADFRREHVVERVDLKGLSQGEIADLVRVAAIGVDDAQTVAITNAILRETDGNAFFVTELLRDRQSAVPSSVREVIAQRIARLGRTAGRVLSTAALIGPEFEVDVLVRVVNDGEDAVVDLLERAAAAGLVGEVEEDPGRFRFGHALIYRSLYDTISATRRRRGHRGIAEVLEARSGASPAELARHWLAADHPADSIKVVDYCALAADAAIRALAPDDAVSWYSQAIALEEQRRDKDVRRQAALVLGLAESQRHAGLAEYRETALEAGKLARQVGDSSLLTAAALCRTPLVDSYVSIDAERLALVENALDAIGSSDSPGRARLLAGLAADYTDPRDWERARSLAADAIAVARRTGDRRTLLAVLNTVSNVRCTPDSLRERLIDTAVAVEIADQVGDHFAGQVARYTRVLACIEASELGEVDGLLGNMAIFVERHPLPAQQWQLFTLLSWRRLLAGRHDEAEAMANASAAAANQAGQPLAQVVLALQLARLRREQGRLDEIIDVLTELAPIYPTITHFPALVAVVHCELGNLDDAHRNFQLLAAEDFGSFQFDLAWLTAMTLSADAAVDLGDRRAAEVLSRRLEPYASHVSTAAATVDGAVARPLGRLAALLGHEQDAELYFRQALATHQRLESPYWTARTQLELARLCQHQRRHKEARQLTHEAISAANTYNFTALYNHAIDLTLGPTKRAT